MSRPFSAPEHNDTASVAWILVGVLVLAVIASVASFVVLDRPSATHLARRAWLPAPQSTERVLVKLEQTDRP